MDGTSRLTIRSELVLIKGDSKWMGWNCHVGREVTKARADSKSEGLRRTG